MVNHQIVRHWPTRAQAVNGHQPMIFFNVSTGHAMIYCATCGWQGRGYRRRWHERVELQWREHAADIAMNTAPIAASRPSTDTKETPSRAVGGNTDKESTE